MIASVPFDVYGFAVNIGSLSQGANNTSILADIGIGATPDILVANIGMGYCGPPRPVFFPLYIPAGTQIQARFQAAFVTAFAANVDFWIWLMGGNGTDIPFCGTRCVTYGANTTTSRGVQVTAGSTNAEGTYATIGTAAEAHRALVLSPQANGDTTLNNQYFYIDVCADGGTSRTDADFEDMIWWTENAEHVNGPHPYLIPQMNIRSGDNIRARASTSGSTNRDIDVIAHGIS